MAVNRRQKPQEADYFRVNAWREMGDNCAKYLAKGRKVAVVGSISLNTYKGSDGQTKASMDILASNVEFLSPKGEQTNDAPDGFVPVNPEGLPF